MYRQEFVSTTAVALSTVIAGCTTLGSNGSDDDSGTGADDGDESENDDNNADDVPETAVFQVSNLEPTEWAIEAGMPIDVSATITNTGVEADRQEIELRVGGEALAVDSIALEPDEAENVSFASVETGDLDLGSHTVGVFSADDDETGTLDVPRRLESGSDDTERGVLRSIRGVSGRFDPYSYERGGARGDSIDGFDLDDGLTVVTFKHVVGREFVVEFIEASERDVTQVGAYTGDVEGATAVPMVAGEYALAITTAGSSYWTIGVAQPSPPEKAIHLPPVTASGTGPDVVGPVELDGEVTIHAGYEGDSTFELTCYDNDATSPSDALTVFEEDGEFERETTVEFEGTTWFTVDGTGAWEFEID